MAFGSIVSGMATGSAALPAEARIGLEDFEVLVRRCQRRVYRVIHALVGDRDEADSLTQECFLRAYRSRSGFRGQASAETWLVSIALNLARDHGKSRRGRFWRRAVKGMDPSGEEARSWRDPAPSPEAALCARERVARVFAMVGGLSPQQREVFLLRFVEELSLDEIAAALGVSEGTAKTHLHRAVSALRHGLRE